MQCIRGRSIVYFTVEWGWVLLDICSMNEHSNAILVILKCIWLANVNFVWTNRWCICHKRNRILSWRNNTFRYSLQNRYMTWHDASNVRVCVCHVMLCPLSAITYSCIFEIFGGKSTIINNEPTKDVILIDSNNKLTPFASCFKQYNPYAVSSWWWSEHFVMRTVAYV